MRNTPRPHSRVILMMKTQIYVLGGFKYPVRWPSFTMCVLMCILLLTVCQLYCSVWWWVWSFGIILKVTGCFLCCKDSKVHRRLCYNSILICLLHVILQKTLQIKSWPNSMMACATSVTPQVRSGNGEFLTTYLQYISTRWRHWAFAFFFCPKNWGHTTKKDPTLEHCWEDLMAFSHKQDRYWCRMVSSGSLQFIPKVLELCAFREHSSSAGHGDLKLMRSCCRASIGQCFSMEIIHVRRCVWILLDI